MAARLLDEDTTRSIIARISAELKIPLEAKSAELMVKVLQQRYPDQIDEAVIVRIMNGR